MKLQIENEGTPLTDWNVKKAKDSKNAEIEIELASIQEYENELIEIATTIAYRNKIGHTQVQELENRLDRTYTKMMATTFHNLHLQYIWMTGKR